MASCFVLLPPSKGLQPLPLPPRPPRFDRPLAGAPPLVAPLPRPPRPRMLVSVRFATPPGTPPAPCWSDCGVCAPPCWPLPGDTRPWMREMGAAASEAGMDAAEAEGDAPPKSVAEVECPAFASASGAMPARSIVELTLSCRGVEHHMMCFGAGRVGWGRVGSARQVARPNWPLW